MHLHDQIGPVGKDVADCAALRSDHGHDPKDSTSLDRKDLDFLKEHPERKSFLGMKFGVPKEFLARS